MVGNTKEMEKRFERWDRVGGKKKGPDAFGLESVSLGAADQMQGC